MNDIGSGPGMRNFVVVCVFIILVAFVVYLTNTDRHEQVYSDIETDENVVFFRTTAWFDEAQQEWHVPIHGWIYEPEDSDARKKLFSALLKNEYELVPDDKSDGYFTRRLNLLIVDNERGKQIVVAMAGNNYTLPPSDVNGHFETTLTLPAAAAEKFIDDARIRFSAITRKTESRTFSGEVLLIDPTGLSIISDIDDTVKISNVNDRRSLLEHTFLLEFVAVPDMAQVYKEWSKNGGSLHFVSSSPWQLYTPLNEFLDGTGFSRSTLDLKSVRFRDETLLDLFKKGTETKPKVIEKILNAYPGRQFILVGDSGEQDPEVYAALLHKYPDQILKAYIRNVTQESPDNERFETVFENIDKVRWQLFEHPLTLVVPEGIGE